MSGFTVDEIRKSPELLEQLAVHEQTEALCRAAIDQEPEAIQYVKNQTDALCLYTVQQDPWSLRFIKNQTEAICLEAIRRDPEVLSLARNQTYTLCLAAVKQYGLVLRAVEALHAMDRPHTRELCRSAVEQNGGALEYVKLPYDALADPESGQLGDWRVVLAACAQSDELSYRAVIEPLCKAVPLGKQYIAEWAQLAPDGALMLDTLQELATEMKRLFPNMGPVKQLCHGVNRQVEMALVSTAPAPSTERGAPVNLEGVL